MILPAHTVGRYKPRIKGRWICILLRRVKVILYICRNYHSVKKFLPLLFFIFHLSFFICSGQNHVIDSLQQVLKTEKEDTNKVNTLYELAWKLSENNPDTAIILDKQGLQLAEKIQWKS